MGFRSQMKLAAAGATVARGELLPFPRKTTAISSPWADSSNLVPMLVAKDVFGVDSAAVSRLEALKVPVIAKGRALLHSLIASNPLVALNAEGKLPDEKQPTWLYRSDTGVSPYQRTCAILDDHLFEWASLLAVSRGAKGDILDAVHVPFERWSVNEHNAIMVDGELARDDQVLLIPGPAPGLLTIADEAIRAARATEQAWVSRVRNPFPAMVLQETADYGMNQDEAKPYVEAVAKARRNPDSAVMFIPYTMSLTAHNADKTDLFENGRNAQRLDFANYMNMPASVLEGSLSTASLTYSTQDGKYNEVFAFTIPYWTQPLEQALSMDNVVPRGQRIRFDLTNLRPDQASPTGAAEQD
ncbi:phage portal protein [Leifsonia poae]|uniref:phage portal protein n=1 Tax=Leifsonia poae TaxID=110933 RepID=UPI001CBFA833|nr:phage portal protein [Leifsonia poae]